MAAGSIVIDLLMKTGSFETDTKRAEARLKQLEKEAKKVGAAIGTAFVAAAAATAYFVKSAIDAADAASKTAQSVGLTVEAYTALAFAADLSGVSQEELSTALTRLSSKAVDAANGSKTAGAAFKAMGIDVKDASGAVKDSDKLLGEIANKFAGYADGAAKTALAVDLFGRSGAKLIPLLNAGSAGIEELKQEAKALGIVLDTETAKAAEKFNDDLSRLGTAVKGFGNDLMIAAMPPLNAMVEELVKLAKNAREADGAVKPLRDFFNWVAVDIAKSSAQIYIMNINLAQFVSTLRLIKDVGLADPKDLIATARRAWSEFNAISEGVKADTARALSQLAAFEQRVRLGAVLTGARLDASTDPRSLTFGKTAPAAPGMPSGGGGSAAKAAADKAAQYLETLRKQLQGTKDLSVEEALLADIQAGRLGKVLPAQEAELRGVARMIDAAKASEKAMQEATKAAQERSDARNREEEQIEASIRAAQEADSSRLKSLLGGTASAQLQSVKDDIRFLNEQFSKGAIDDVNQWAEAVTQATGRLKQSGEEMDSFSKQMAENVQTFLGGAFAEAMDGNFKNIGKSFTSMLNRMVAEALAADLARRIFGSASGGTGDGWIGAALKFAGSMFGGGKAGGGDVMPGREYWVGENGPERFRPRSMGTIIPASTSSQKNVTNNLNVNVMAQQGVSRQSAMQQGEAIGRGIQLAMARNG